MKALHFSPLLLLKAIKMASALLVVTVFASVLTISRATAQTALIDSLRGTINKLEKDKNYSTDKVYLQMVNDFARELVEYQTDTALAIIDANLQRAKAIGFKEAIVDAYKIKGNAYTYLGNNDLSLENYQLALKVAKELDDYELLAGINNNIGLAYNAIGNNAEALKHYYTALEEADKAGNEFVSSVVVSNIGIILFSQKKYQEAAEKFWESRRFSDEIQDTIGIILAYSNLAEIEMEKEEYDKALSYLDTAYLAAKKIDIPESIINTTRMMGMVNERAQRYSAAKQYFQESISEANEHNIRRFYGHALLGLAKVEFALGANDTAKQLAEEALMIAVQQKESTVLRDAHELLAQINEQSGNLSDALFHYKHYTMYADSINGLDAARASATYAAEYEFSKKELAFERTKLLQQIIIFSSLLGFIVLAVILFILNRHKKKIDKAYHALEEQHLMNNEQRIALQKTLDELQRTQVQLIQSEKMASLGVLTAGIAHEIRNPLNFVSNFSEISKELFAELAETIEAPDADEATVKLLIKDLQSNMDKIIHHGQRADGIVQTMIQHAKITGGEIEKASLNNLAAEHLKSTLGESKEKSPALNVVVETDYEGSLPEVGMVKLDIGRVIHNLLDNAFYALAQRAAKEGDSYKPKLKVSTFSNSQTVYISVADNGTGISPEIRDKIFQPFFTTKPTGEGTGLGLSLSYDIVKAHGGDLLYKETLGGGATFELSLAR